MQAQPKETAQQVADTMAQYVITDTKVLLKRIKEVEADMMVKARDLQFEQAAKLRDEVKRLKEALLMQQI